MPVKVPMFMSMAFTAPLLFWVADCSALTGIISSVTRSLVPEMFVFQKFYNLKYN